MWMVFNSLHHSVSLADVWEFSSHLQTVSASKRACQASTFDEKEGILKKPKNTLNCILEEWLWESRNVLESKKVCSSRFRVLRKRPEGSFVDKTCDRTFNQSFQHMLTLSNLSKKVRKPLWNFVVNFQFNQSFSMESFHWKPTSRLSPRFWVELVKIKMRGASFGTRLWRCLLSLPPLFHTSNFSHITDSPLREDGK